MNVEISVALNFVISYLYSKLPRRRVDMFAEEIERGLQKKFEGHWYPDKPVKGSGFRCVRVTGEKIDPVLIHAAAEAGLDINEVKGFLPDELTIWIDPNEVSYRMGEKGPIKILYSDRKEDTDGEMIETEIQVANKGFNPDAQCFKPIDSLSSSLGSLSLSPSPSGSWSTSTSPSNALFSSSSTLPTFLPKHTTGHNVVANKNTLHPQFTASTFAQTKFGSTKLKTQAKRPTRLSPTEFNSFLRQRSNVSGGYQSAGLSPSRPRSLSPRDPRVDPRMDYIFGQQQQQRLYLQQQQQQQQQQQPKNVYLTDMYRQQSPNSHTPAQNMGFGEYLPSNLNSPQGSPMNSLSPEGHKSFIDGLNLSTGHVSYPNQFHPSLLLAS